MVTLEYVSEISGFQKSKQYCPDFTGYIMYDDRCAVSHVIHLDMLFKIKFKTFLFD